MRILVTGASGWVGKKLCEYLCRAEHKIIPIARCHGYICADLRDESTVFGLVKEYAPDLIIHLAAITDIRFCEQNKEIAHATNYGITEILTRACVEFGIRMLFFSSDYVFGNSEYAWQEQDMPCPTTQYGIDKATSEQVIQERLSNYAIIRTAQLYGFAGDFVSLVCKSLKAQQKFMAFANLVNCPTWIGDLLPMVNKIITHNRQGIFHCVGEVAMSRYQYACEIAKTFMLDASYIHARNLNFSEDIRPAVVWLNGASTYKTLQIYPSSIKDNLPLCASYAMEVSKN